MNNTEKTYRFLLIEDNPVDSRVFRHTLSYTALSFDKLQVSESLADGLAMIESFHPDAIFLDLNLPDSMGISSFRLLRSIAQSTPVIILTAVDDEEIAKDALREGAQDYLLKDQLTPGLLNRSVQYSIQRKQFENDLWKSKASTEALIENTNDGIWSVDRNFRFVTINSAFRESFYLISGNIPVIGECLLDSINKENRSWFREVTERAMNGERFTIQKTFLFGSRTADIELSVNPITGKSKDIEGVSFFARDITERKIAELKIRQREADFRKLVETMNEGLLYLDGSGIPKFANRRFYEISGYEPEDILEKRIPAANGWEILQEQLSSGEREMSKELQHETILSCKNGDHKWCVLGFSKTYDTEGANTGILVTITDINEKKVIEEKLKSARTELQTFIYRSSHDLKGPLSSILGLISLVEQEKVNDTVMGYNGMIRSSAEKLDKMLNILLNVVRIQNESIKPEEIDFNRTFEEIFAGFKNNPDYKEVKSNIDIHSSHKFHTDKKILCNILHNIIDNAIKFSSSNPGREVDIRVNDFLNGVKITIKDNGKGIDEQTRNNMFFMFYRGDNNTKGSGLGLYVVRNAVDRLGGFIEFSTEESKFTQFDIYLPDLIITAEKKILGSGYQLKTE